MSGVDVKSAVLLLAAPYAGGPLATLGVALLLAAIVIGVVATYAAVAVYVERKVASFIQCRLGPMEVGPNFAVKVGGLQILPPGWYGLGVMIADGVKLMAKEDIIPTQADAALFRFAPYVVFAATLAAFAVIPFGSFLAPSGLDAGILFLLAASSVGIFGLVMGGYASNNKWSLYGAIRSVAQIISYEVPMGLALLSVVVTTASLDLREISNAQAGWFWRWHVFTNIWLFIGFIAYFIASLAETNRTPFDIPEAESELVAGYHTEYSGMRFAIFFLAEYANMLLVSLVAAVFFLGGYHSGIAFLDRFSLLGPVIILGKALALVGVMIWLRWTLPRYRVDRLMVLCWKGLLPLSLIAFLGAGVAVFQPSLVMRIILRLPILLVLGLFVAAVLKGLRPAPKRAGKISEGAAA
jgi:NADH-quinone oxidoreductase subunit H